MAEEEKKEETSLAEIQQHAQASIQKYSDKTFADMSKKGDYLCRLQLCGSNSKLCKQDKIKKGNYAYIVAEDNFIDLGSSVDILPICWRPKALDMSGDTPTAFYDPSSEAFKDVSARSEGKDSMCTFGPEFLVWIPQIEKFASLHMGSKTSRGDAGGVRDLLGKPCTLTWRKIETPKFIWEAITPGPCSTPFKLPLKDELTKEVEKFNNEAQQKAPEKAQQGRAR